MKFQALIPKRSLFTGRKDDQDYQLDSDYDDCDLTNSDAYYVFADDNDEIAFVSTAGAQVVITV